MSFPTCVCRALVCSNTKKAAQALGAALALLLVCLNLFSQGGQGTIQGGMFDQTGGAIAGATITVIDVARGVTRALTTDGAGQYVATNLTPGTYTVRAEAKGFRAVEHTGVLVEVGQSLRVDMVVQPGEQTQTITVTGEVPAIDTTDASLGGTVSNESINSLPLNGRNFQRLLQLRPGVVTAVGAGAGASSTNGRRSGEDILLVEGIPTMGQVGGGSLINAAYRGGDSASLLPIDAIQEFNEQQDPKAEYGWKEGSVVNIGIKSGTNSLHGTAWAFGRNASATDAANFFSNTVTPATLEQFGATAGARIIKDKLFWFASFEGLRETLGDVAVVTIPTSVAMPSFAGSGCKGLAAGNCSQSMVDACNDLNPTHLANGAAGNPISALSAQLSGLNTATCVVSPSSATTENLWPYLPNATSNLFAPALTSIGPLNNGIFKGDYIPGPHHHISGMFFASKAFQISNTSTGQLLPQWEAAVPLANYLYEADWAWTPNSSWVNVARAGYVYLRNLTNPVDVNTLVSNPWPTGYGLNTGVTNPLYGGLPQLKISAFQGYLGANARVGRRGPHGNLEITDSVSHLVGKHSFKFGVESTEIIYDSSQSYPSQGVVSFKTLESFLQGVPNSETILIGDPTVNVRSHWFAGFFQDDWRLTPRVTLNLGLRYEVATPPVERNNYLGTFNPNVTGNTPAFEPFGPGTSVPSQYNIDLRGWSPRLGVAWDVRGNGKTVVRAGTSVMGSPPVLGELVLIGPEGANFPDISVNTSGTALNAHTPVQPSFGGCGQPACVVNGVTQVNWTQAGPIFPTSNAVNIGGVTYTGVTCTAAAPCPVNTVDRNFRSPHVVEWNVDIQRAITNNLTIDVAYVGNHGFNEETTQDLNQPKLGTGFNAPWTAAQLVAAKLPAGDLGLTSNQICLGQGTTGFAVSCPVNTTAETLAQPYVGKFPYLSYINASTIGDVSNYDALQVSVDERFSHGLRFLAGYTYAHALDTLNSAIGGGSILPSDNANLRLNYGNSDSDLRHRFTFSPSYAIPGIKSPGQMLQGWAVSGILVLQQGFPWSASDGSNDFLGTNENNNQASSVSGAFQPWNFSGPGSAFTSGPTSIPCYGGLPGCTSFAKTPAATLSACQTAAQAPYAGNAQLQQLALASLANFACFVQGSGILTPPAYGTVGNASRNIFRAPNYYNVDLSVAKDWKFKERFSAQFRMEFFNLFNRADFGLPGGASVGTGTSIDPNQGVGGRFGCSCNTPDASNPVLGSGGPRHIQFGLKLGF